MEALILQWLQVTSLESIFGQVREESFSESLLIYIDIDAVSVLEFDSKCPLKFGILTNVKSGIGKLASVGKLSSQGNCAPSMPKFD